MSLLRYPTDIIALPIFTTKKKYLNKDANL